MLDEKALNDLMTEAAERQDHLLPRAVEDDIAAGRRRLVRTRLVTGTGIFTAVAAVAAVVVGATVWGDSRTPGLETPAATSSATATATATNAPAKTPPRSWANENLGPTMRAALVRHLDPGKDHLRLDNEVIPAFGQPGLRQATAQVGWRIAGQSGEGVIWLELADSERAIGKLCGASRVMIAKVRPSDCREVRLENGRTAQVAKRGGEFEVGYARPDGGVVYVIVGARFHQNTTIPVHDLGITQDQLLALVQDESLRLPALTPAEQAEKERLLRFGPDTTEMYGALERVLANGQLSDPYKYFVPEQAEASATWSAKSSAAKQFVAVSVDVKSMVSECSEQVRVDCMEKVALPDGRVVWFGENKAAGRMGARYEQPDGDMAFVAVASTAGPQQGGITRDQVIRLVTDAALNDK
jgi:hypothetical protein